MRTKTLLLSALACAVGASAASAQVYSVNAVGYINVDLKAGFNLISNPLVPSSGELDLNSLIPEAPADSSIFIWDSASQSFSSEVPVYIDGLGWLPNPTLGEGEGVFMQVAADTTLTFVGEVRQGDLSTSIPAGFSIVSSQVPQEASLNSLGLSGTDGDFVFVWNSDQQAYESEVPTYIDGLGWLPDPTVGVGDAFFVQATASGSWDRNFNVNE